MTTSSTNSVCPIARASSRAASSCESAWSAFPCSRTIRVSWVSARSANGAKPADRSTRRAFRRPFGLGERAAVHQHLPEDDACAGSGGAVARRTAVLLGQPQPLDRLVPAARPLRLVSQIHLGEPDLSPLAERPVHLQSETLVDDLVGLAETAVGLVEHPVGAAERLELVHPAWPPPQRARRAGSPGVDPGSREPALGSTATPRGRPPPLRSRDRRRAGGL